MSDQLHGLGRSEEGNEHKAVLEQEKAALNGEMGNQPTPPKSTEPTCSKEEALMKRRRERSGRRRSKRRVKMDEGRAEAGDEREGK